MVNNNQVCVFRLSSQKELTMLDLLKDLLFPERFIPHGHCYLWQTNLVGLHILSDALIAIAYYSIPIGLLYFLQKREDVPFRGIFVLFGMFIIACGTTHLMSIWTLWYPAYWISGLIKAATAIISCYTALSLVPLLPQALSLPSPGQLEAINRNLQEQIANTKQAQIALQESERKFRVIFDQTFQFMGLLQPNGTLIEINQTALTFAKCQLKDVLNKPFWETPWWNFSTATQERLKAAIAQAATGKFIRYEVEMRGASEEVATFDFSLKPLNNEEGQVVMLIPEGRDISATKRTEELQKAKEVADTANRAKSEFLANMSHEIRTPMNAILGFTQLMLRDSTFPQEYRNNLEIIHRSSEHLLTLINQILDISKIEAGCTTLHKTAFDLYCLLEDVEAMLQIQAKDKGLQLLFDYPNHLPQYVQTDEVKLRQVLINLLSNALKFTEEGGVSVRISCLEEGKAENGQGSSFRLKDNQEVINIHFEIEDTGAGIAPEELGTLFDIFSQTQTGKQSKQGTGLGLPISRKFVQLMGGDITVTSQVNQGTVFKFDITANRAEVTQILTEQSTRRVIALQPNQPTYRILVVDDRSNNRQLLSQLLNPLGFELQEATNGVDAIKVWQSWQPHLIFMDMRMPVMDGYEATKQIKATIEGQATTIIAVTASSLDSEKENFPSTGFDDFIRKPFRELAIFSAIFKHLGVQYIYEQELVTSASLNPTEVNFLTPETLAILPKDWLEEFKRATAECDTERMQNLIEQIRQPYESLANALTDLTNSFKFEQLTALLSLD